MSDRNSNRAKNTAKKAVKKAYKKNPKAVIISIIAIVLVIAITVAVIYFAFPDTWDRIMVAIGVKQEEVQDGNGGNTPSNPDSDTNPPVLVDGELQIHFLDVGQGDCILILFPDGKDMLIDCANYNDDGDYEKQTLNYLDTYIPDDQLDYLMVTHGDSDHTYFVNEVIDTYDVDTIYMPFVKAEPSNETLQA